MEIEKLQKKKETRSSLFKNINKINEPLARLRKIEKPQITNTRNEIGNIPDTEIIKKNTEGSTTCNFMLINMTT